MLESCAMTETVTLHTGGLHYGSEKAVVEEVLGRRPGVIEVEANAAAQTATVSFEPDRTEVEELRRWVEECGLHCEGKSTPDHDCDPLAESGHAEMSMADMVRDMRNRFLVALAFTIPTVLWSEAGANVLGTELATPFGIEHDIWLLLLSLPIVLYASSIFFTGALR